MSLPYNLWCTFTKANICRHLSEANILIYILYIPYHSIPYPLPNLAPNLADRSSTSFPQLFLEILLRCELIWADVAELVTGRGFDLVHFLDVFIFGWTLEHFGTIFEAGVDNQDSRSSLSNKSYTNHFWIIHHKWSVSDHYRNINNRFIVYNSL
jgi:hypothetical protein